MSAQDQTALFDDRSRYVDRFGLLLALTVTTVIALSLVDLREPFGDAGSELGFAVVTVLAGSMFLIALRASGVAHRWQTLADILVGSRLRSSWAFCSTTWWSTRISPVFTTVARRSSG